MGQLRLLGEPPASDDHAALANLAFPQAGHTGFVAAAGLAGGQTIIGGTAPGENLSLQSTAGSPRGVVQVIDSLRLVGGLIQDGGGNPRVTLATATPHLTLTGDLRVTGYAALAGATPATDAYLKVNPVGATWTSAMTLLQMNPTSCSIGVGGDLFGFGAYAVCNVLTGATPLVRGLNFVGLVANVGSPVEVTGAACQVGCMAFSGTITDLHALYAVERFIMFTGGGSITRTHGLRIGDQGKAGVGTTFGLLIEPQTGSANLYSIWAGAKASGTPRLRLDEGTPGAGQTMLWLAEGVTPTVRRVQWVDPGNGGANLVAGQRVMVLV
jgi:hypothetical protein